MKQLHIYYVLFLLLTFIPQDAIAQIRGVITDSLTHEPLMFVNVQYKGSTFGTRSNEEGEYRLTIRQGFDEIIFSYMGYKTKIVKVQPGESNMDIQLCPDNIVLSELVSSLNANIIRVKTIRLLILCVKLLHIKRI